MLFPLLPVQKLNNSNHFFQNFHKLPTLIPIGMLKVNFNRRNLDLKADQNTVRVCMHACMWRGWGGGISQFLFLSFFVLDPVQFLFGLLLC